MARGRTLMLRSHKTTDADGVRGRLNELQAAVRREADSAEADPFDEAMIAAVLGAAEALKAAADALAELGMHLGKLARNA